MQGRGNWAAGYVAHVEAILRQQLGITPLPTIAAALNDQIARARAEAEAKRAPKLAVVGRKFA